MSRFYALEPHFRTQLDNDFFFLPISIALNGFIGFEPAFYMIFVMCNYIYNEGKYGEFSL